MRTEVESFALLQLDCVNRKMHRCTVLLRQKKTKTKLSSTTGLLASIQLLR